MPAQPSPPMKYRKDIDGLRAVAVIPVVLFHAKVPGFPGGFVGVDVFFVISGFLITGLMADDFRFGRLSFLTFYARRIRRIVPALLCVYAAVMVAAAVLMLPADMAEVGRSLRSSALFVSNVFFFGESGYFGGDAGLKPLLHTWSLSIEEQFYLLWPLLFWVVARWRPALLLPAVCIAGSLSFAAMLVEHGNHTEAVFFLAPFRAWELMLGAGLALLPVRPPASARAWEVVAGVGFLLILVTVALGDEATAALATIPACLGTGLLILAGNNNPDEGAQPAVLRALSFPLLVGIGLISYSLYLWHWPILVFAGYQLDRAFHPAETAGLLALSVAVAAVTYRYVEQPARHLRLRHTRRIVATGLSVLAAFAFLGHRAYKDDGWTFNLDPAIRQLDAFSRAENPYRRKCNGPGRFFGNESACAFGRPYHDGSYDMVIFGDSHGNHYVPAMAKLAAEAGLSGRQISVGGCLALLGYTRIISPYAHEERCRALREALVRFVETNPRLQLVVLAHAWSVYVGEPLNGLPPFSLLASAGDERSPGRSFEVMRQSLEKTLDYFMAKGVRVLLLGEVPLLSNDPMRCLARSIKTHRGFDDCGRPLSEVRARVDRINALLAQLAQQRTNVTYYSPLAAMCHGARCEAVVDGVYMYRDRDHLNRFGSEALARSMRLPLGQRGAASEAVR
ncbi:MAG TPA: acyltransferase family protein [Hyphomicrobiaceae bacterium]|nr:acyltransferase family protein [Hyphomicrobiaceae bacterium]